MPQKVNPVDPESDEATDVAREFDDQVNMTAKELDRWLSTDDSKDVGQEDGGESTGHRSGRRIVKILQKKKSDRSAEDLAHMKKVNGYISRHLKQRPKKSGEELAQTAWARSLKNWGHDPQK